MAVVRRSVTEYDSSNERMLVLGDNFALMLNVVKGDKLECAVDARSTDVWIIVLPPRTPLWPMDRERIQLTGWSLARTRAEGS